MRVMTVPGFFLKMEKSTKVENFPARTPDFGKEVKDAENKYINR